ncbi:hypothetical protein SAMN05444166_8337 [Singulisphaera sp. GP187]|uniref:hypothetical protein n=1 Tax=Singulisphaera sp. GP187 TaxID=1882752 RepID=UPI00092B9C92|nr:hypothetical protein [Singulisphaera sp. GP187]SIO67331.1 hypothetical protein SAMN05444166_8337 [Singulisphaera sp. GP187]
MAQYRTEVFIADDRYVCLQLPANLPTGRALVTVVVVSSDPSDPEPAPDVEPDHQDIEWWDEFDEDRERVG